MAGKPEVRIIARPVGGKVELSVYEVYRMREHRTGWTVWRSELDAKVRQLKETLERSGNRVTFKML